MRDITRQYLREAKNLPNMLTIFRFLLIPVFLLLRMNGCPHEALAVFVIASVTDALDGTIARKTNQITAFGKIMDPLADKLMVCSALLCQVAFGIFPMWAVGIVVGKELLMVLGGLLIYRKDIIIPSRIFGKCAQVFFIIALLLSFFHDELAGLGFQADLYMLYLAVATAVIAGLDYLRILFPQVRNTK